MSSSFVTDLRGSFGDRAREDVSLAPFTTFKVGGPADCLVEARSTREVVEALRIARLHAAPVTVLGGGSNVLIGDRGIRGLVVLVRGNGEVALEGDGRVRADAGVTINGLVRWTISRGLSGLEAWAGTPGTVGGAIHGNAHFRGRPIGDLVEAVRLATPAGDVRDVPGREMAFAYDTSRLQGSGEVLLSAVFRVGRDDPGRLRETARASLHYRKATQPLNLPSAGCIFQNPGLGEVPPDAVPSAGALIDRCGLKGASEGGARVSAVHGNFIVNDGTATAADVRALVERCRREVAARFGVRLRDEVVCLGEF